MDAPAQPSVGELFHTLAGETGLLVRQELTLAGAELGVKAKAVAVSSSMIVVGAGIGFAAILALGATAVVALTEAVPLWAACLIVSGFWTLLAAGLLSTGLARLRAFDPVPLQTLASLRDVAQLRSSGRAPIWPKEQTP